MAMMKKPAPPLIMLDEVDAHLDNENVELLSKFLAEWKDSPQILMISHKEQAVCKSDSLIGVSQQEYYKLPERCSDDQVASDQDLDKHKYLTAVTFNLDLRNM